MFKLIIIFLTTLGIFGTANAGGHSKVNLGIILGFTGPIESLTPDMASGAEFAISEVNESGAFKFGEITSVRADSTCIDNAAATAATERLITSDNVNAIIGGDCSGVTQAMLENVALPNGVVMISPSATSPALSSVKDNDLFFRTSPSDARQGQVIKDILIDKGYKKIAISYVNTDYGKGLSDSIANSFVNAGGEITINASHENGKGDYGAEVAALSQAGGEILVVAGYLDQGGKGIIEAALDSGAFDTFFLPDGMIGDSLPQNIGPDLNGSIGSVPGVETPGSKKLTSLAKDFNGSGPYAPESYDAAALIILAMQQANSIDSNDFKIHVLDIANSPGEKIYPGELGKALELLKQGKHINYEGASGVELIAPGEAAGSYREILVENGENKTVNIR